MTKEIYVVDTETTGLNGYPEDVIVEIAICKVNISNRTVEKIYETIVGHDVDSWNKQQKNAWIFENSNLKIEHVKKASPQEKVAKKVREILKGKYVTSFNLGFDFDKFLSRNPWNLSDTVQEIVDCIMLAATPVCRIEGSYGDYKWPKLEEAYSMLCSENPANIGDQTHRAIDDTLMASHVLLSLIQSKNYSLL